MSHRLTRTLIIATLTLLALVVKPAPARADLTAFWGITPTTSVRDTRGVSIGWSATVVGAEYEWAKTTEAPSDGAPGLKTHSFNGMLISPGRKVSIYLSAGLGRYTETAIGVERTGTVTNFGVGGKVKLAGPLRARIDFRSFNLRGTPLIKSPKRLYGGLTIAF